MDVSEEVINMNIPGYTADASLYKTNGRYHSVVHQDFTSRKQKVVSQMRAGGFGGAAGSRNNYEPPRWPSGGCWEEYGYYCCEFCWYGYCYYWCWPM